MKIRLTATVEQGTEDASYDHVQECLIAFAEAAGLCHETVAFTYAKSVLTGSTAVTLRVPGYLQDAKPELLTHCPACCRGALRVIETVETRFYADGTPDSAGNSTRLDLHCVSCGISSDDMNPRFEAMIVATVAAFSKAHNEREQAPA